MTLCPIPVSVPCVSMWVRARHRGTSGAISRVIYAPHRRTTGTPFGAVRASLCTQSEAPGAGQCPNSRGCTDSSGPQQRERICAACFVDSWTQRQTSAVFEHVTTSASLPPAAIRCWRWRFVPRPNRAAVSPPLAPSRAASRRARPALRRPSCHAPSGAPSARVV